MDGEAVVTGADGVAVFDALHRRHKATDAMLYAFDLLEFDGEDLRPLPLSERKAKLLARAPAGIVFNEHTDEDGAVIGPTGSGKTLLALFVTGLDGGGGIAVRQIWPQPP
jgi:ATP-dependent DNA ligase